MNLIRIPKLLLIAFILIWGSYSMAAPPYVFGDFSKRQKKKESSRWTLAGWMDQKSKFRSMDQWLALNTSPNSIELFVSATYFEPDVEIKSGGSPLSDDSDVVSGAELGFYYRIFGLVGEWSNSDLETQITGGRFQLRFFGTSTQSTSLNLLYGFQDLKADGFEDFSNYYYGGEIEVYFAQWFGVHGHYRSLVKSEASDDTELEGQYWRAGVFLEWGAFRLFSQWSERLFEFTPATGPAQEIKSYGIESGLKIYL